jgi:two-component system, OmpR family, response regulator
MSLATTIIFAKDDLTIPGAAEDSVSGPGESAQSRFFDLVSRSQPDVIVLDLSKAPEGAGTDTILTVRQRTDIPILVICRAEAPLVEDFRIAGAADCIPVPIEIITLNRAIWRILRISGRGQSAASRAPKDFCFGAMRFDHGRNSLAGENGSTVELTSSEGRLLAHLASKPWTICTRSEIGQLLYGPEHSVGDRAIDIIVNRLRKKLAALGGADAEQLIKTEFRRGYLLVADVATLPRRAPSGLHFNGSQS